MFESRRLKLTAVNEEDLKVIYTFYNDYAIAAGITYTGGVVRPWTYDEFKKDMEDTRGKYAVKLKETGEIIGMAVLTDEPLTRILYPMTYIKPNERGRGLGTELSILLTRLAFDEWNAHKICTTIYDFNVVSFKRYETLGWKLEGMLRQEVFRNGQYWDVRHYGILRQEWETFGREIAKDWEEAQKAAEKKAEV